MKKSFLILLVISLIISGFLSILNVLIGVGTGQVLLSTFCIAGYSILGLCCSTLYEKNKNNIFSLVGIITVILGFIFSFGFIWSWFDTSNEIIKIFFSSIVIPVSFAHASLILLIDSKNIIVKTSVIVTTICIGIFAVMLTYLIWTFGTVEIPIKIIAVLGIIESLGTIVSPILNKTFKD